MNIKEAKNIYMIGIKGVGMTMLAQYLSENGKNITGSDTDEKFMTDQVLEKCGIQVIEKFDKENIPKNTDVIIYSTAYKAKNNVEVEFALSSKTTSLTYAEALSQIFNQKLGIAVAGSHGKTTTSAWLAYVMEKSDKSPSAMIGARVPQLDGASITGYSDYLIIEADEYQNKFKYYQPKAVLLNNIDYDHPDFFKTEQDYVDTFIRFIEKIPQNGFLVANYDDYYIKKIANVNTRAKVITYAINESADYVAYNVKQQGAEQTFNVKLGESGFIDDEILTDSELGEFSIKLSGVHNIYNALAVVSSCIELGVDLVDIRTHLSEFTGTARRMETMGKFRGATIIDDYAHHPTEIRTTLAGLRQLYLKNKIKVVFHPHTFTRTKQFFNEFSECFSDADELIVLDIYGSAREKQGGVSSEELVEKIRKSKSEIRNSTKHISNLKEVEEYLRENIERDDIVLLMGAGDVFRIGENLVK